MLFRGDDHHLAAGFDLLDSFPGGLNKGLASGQTGGIGILNTQKRLGGQAFALVEPGVLLLQFVGTGLIRQIVQHVLKEYKETSIVQVGHAGQGAVALGQRLLFGVEPFQLGQRLLQTGEPIQLFAESPGDLFRPGEFRRFLLCSGGRFGGEGGAGATAATHEGQGEAFTAGQQADGGGQ